MTRAQAGGVLLIILGLIYAFVYVGWLRRDRAGTGSSPSWWTLPGRRRPVSETGAEPVPAHQIGSGTEVGDATPAAGGAADPGASTAPAAVERPPTVAEGLPGQYGGTRVGRERSAAKNLGTPGPGRMSVGAQGVTWRPEDGTALRAEPSVIGGARLEDGAVVILWHPDPATSHQTSFTAGSAADTSALLDALEELPGIPVDRTPTQSGAAVPDEAGAAAAPDQTSTAVEKDPTDVTSSPEMETP